MTASPGAVIVQGYPQDGRLNQLRERLREALTHHGLGESLDTRYRIKAAHATVLRFQAQLQNPKTFMTTLQQYQNYDFGTTTLSKLQLVKNDWYMSTDTLEVLAEYPLL